MNMRFWHFWLNSFILASQFNPPRFVELLMLMLAIATILPDRPYLVLGLSLVVGASISILVREAIAPSHQSQITKLTALLLLFN